MKMSMRMRMRVSESVSMYEYEYEYEYGIPYRVSTEAVFPTGNLKYPQDPPICTKEYVCPETR